MVGIWFPRFAIGLLVRASTRTIHLISDLQYELTLVRVVNCGSELLNKSKPTQLQFVEETRSTTRKRQHFSAAFANKRSLLRNFVLLICFE